MMIIWTGKNCSDGCPFFYPSPVPRCKINGRVEVGTNTVFCIYLEIEGNWDEAFVPRPKECPFEDLHGLPLGVYNDE